MEVEPSYLFQLEDGGSLSIAVHSDVPKYDHLCELIRANRGFVVEDISAADFCIISIISTSADEIAAELRSEGKLALYDYWIRDSVEARHLLPWYPYQAGSSNNITPTSVSLVADTEERDIHELIVTSARYWPLLSEEELHRYVSRKCPHRSAISFKQLYSSNRSQIDSRTSYLRGRLGVALAFNNEFNRRPKMTFASPHRRLPLQIEGPSRLAVAPLPTPTSIASGGHAHSAVENSERNENTSPDDREIPYEAPNVDTPSSPPLSRSLSMSMIPHPPRETSGTNTAVTMTLEQRDTMALQTGLKSIPENRRYGRGGRPATHEDKYKVAKFMADNPRGEMGMKPYFEMFRRQNERARLRTSNAWVHIWKTYNAQISQMALEIRKRGGTQTFDKDGDYKAASTRPLATRTMPATKNKVGSMTHTRTKAGAQKERDGTFSLRSALYDTKRRIPLTDQDKQLLAEWMLDNPKPPNSTTIQYFEAFERQYKGPARREGAWQSAWYSYKADIVERQQKIHLERGVASGSGPKQPVSSVRPFSGPLGGRQE